MADKKQDQQQDQQAERKPFTVEERIAYWERKLTRLIHPPKIAHAKKRIEVLTAKLTEQQLDEAQKA